MADITVTAANVAAGANASTEIGTAGVTVTAGQLLYKDSTDSSHLKLADADASQATAQLVGIALHGSLDGQPLKFQVEGDCNPGATVAVGTTYVVSGTAGGIAPIADLASSDYTSILGIATTTSNIEIQLHVSDAQVP